MGTRDWTLKLEPWKDVDTLQMMVDSDWATDKVDRRFTSAGVAQLGGCTIITVEHRDRRDLGTKVLDVNTHRYLCSIIGLGPANQAVEEIKGHKRNSQSSRSVGLLIVWKGLRTLGLGLAQWVQENSTSMNFHELRI